MIDVTHAFDLSYLWRAMVGGAGVAFMAGPLGVFMVWRRLAYFGDTLSHSGLLGITLALALQMNVTVGICFIALMVSYFLWRFQKRAWVGSDTLLGILSYTLLAMGLLTLSAFENIQVDVMGFLYGDILAINNHDLMVIYGGGALVLGLLAKVWPSLLRVSVHRELALVEGVNVDKVEAIYLFLLAIVVAIAIKIVGVLLITGLLLIPAAAARPIAKSPEQMALFASLIGIISVFVGIFISHLWDTPTGPAIVVVSSALFLVTSGFTRIFKIS